MEPALSSSGKSALRKMERNIGELPLLPQVLVKLLQLDRSDDNYFDDFELLVKEDPAFAIRVIAIANSSASAPISPITTIRDAVTRMGATTISNLVASLAVQKVFMPTEPGQVRLWTHSVVTAFAAEQVAKLAKRLNVDPGRAYLAGLLHDIGRFVMMEHSTDELQAVDESNWTSPDELVRADVAVYKYTHSELGYRACKQWGLPDEISDVVRRHHTDIAGPIDPGSIEAMTYCVQVADRVCIFVLENSDAADPDDLVALIGDDCILEVGGQRWVDPESLVECLPPIKEASASLLGGLGFSVAR